MGGKGDYGTEKEVKIKDTDRNGRKELGRRKIHDKIIHQSETKLVSSCRISIFATVKEAEAHFLGLKNGSDVPGIFATILLCQSVW